MATPTPGKHAPTAATPPVSTPFSGSQSHLAAFSPHGPRSVVPSPQQFKKSPANSNTIYGHPTNSSFGAMNFDSPSTAAALGAMPALGDLTLDAAGGIVMTGGLSGPGRGDEDEQKKKLQQVIDIIKVNKGRVSEEGVERLGRRVGLDCLWEDQMGSGGSVRTLVIAGTGLSLEFDFANNAVGKVSVSFPESPEIVTKHSSSAARILQRDLQLQPQESPLTKMLDRFAINLERLATLDKLSVMPSLNCHEAVAGIYESLKRLHEWELSRLLEEEDMKSKSPKQRIGTALCAKSGRPLMNARQNVGLSLDYWQERHMRGKRHKNGKTNDDYDVELKTWSLLVECAPSSALIYTSVRVTDKWISTDIQKANPTAEDLIMETGGAVLDWQEPENVLLPTSAASKVDGAMEGVEQDVAVSSSKFADVMFVAKFLPPLVVPYVVANQIYSSTGATMDHYHVATLDGLLFATKPDEKNEPDASDRRIQQEQAVFIVEDDGRKIQKSHKNTLTFQKPEYGRVLNELPFSHPRQLVDLLPILRQYACLFSLLDKSFGAETEEYKAEKKEEEAPQTLRDEFEAFMSEASSTHEPPQFDILPVDVSLHSQPHPTLRLTFPFRRRTADICFDVGINAACTVTFENILDGYDAGEKGKDKGRQLTRGDLGKLLDISGDIGIFVEFVRRRLQ